MSQGPYWWPDTTKKDGKPYIRKDNVSLMSFDSGEAITEKISPYDTFVQIIDGKAEIVIAGKSHALTIGQGIIIPAHKSQIVIANERFKMISTVIKSGYE
jgi:quercetin dioxygenase-like cupin family protein